MPSNNAGYFRRMFAGIIDMQIVILFLVFPLYLLTHFYPTEQIVIQAVNYIVLYFVIFMFLYIFNIFYYVIFSVLFGGTIGKLLMGLKVVDRSNGELIDSKTAFWRFTAGYIFSSQLIGLGYFRIFRNDERLAWHDELFNTKVIKTKSPFLGIIGIVVFSLLTAFLLFSSFQAGFSKVNQIAPVDNSPVLNSSEVLVN